MTDPNYSSLKQVSLHLGVHKTGSTHLQRSLMRRIGRLNRADISLRIAEALRKNGIVLDRDFEAVMSPEKIQDWRAYFEEASQGAEKLIVSDENLIGSHIRMNMDKSMFMYQSAGKRIALLKQVFDGTQVRVFIAVRNPTDYLESNYSQCLSHGFWSTVQEFRETAPVAEVIWAPVIRKLAALFPVTLWRHEDYMPVFPQIIAQMATPELVDIIKPVPEKHQVALSAKAVEMILDNKIPLSRTTRSEFAKSVRELFPTGKEHKKFRFYDRLERMEGMASYERDVEEIKSIPNVTFLRP